MPSAGKRTTPMMIWRRPFSAIDCLLACLLGKSSQLRLIPHDHRSLLIAVCDEPKDVEGWKPTIASHLSSSQWRIRRWCNWQFKAQVQVVVLHGSVPPLELKGAGEKYNCLPSWSFFSSVIRESEVIECYFIQVGWTFTELFWTVFIKEFNSDVHAAGWIDWHLCLLRIIQESKE